MMQIRSANLQLIRNSSMLMSMQTRQNNTVQSAAARRPSFFTQCAKMSFSEGGAGPEDSPSDKTSTATDSTMADQPSYIKEMKSNRDWQDALENRERPVMIQAGASWCGPCNILKPMLIDAVKAQEGKLEYLYIDIDEHK